MWKRLIFSLCCSQKPTEKPERCYNTEEQGTAVQSGANASPHEK
jgi:hypothetical protein